MRRLAMLLGLLLTVLTSCFRKDLYGDLVLRVKYYVDGTLVTALLPLESGGSPVVIPAATHAVVNATALSDGGWRMTVDAGLTVSAWTLRGDHAINYDATVEVSQGFSFTSAEYPSPGTSTVRVADAAGRFISHDMTL